ncbi:MAG: LVIVD repeat-containing protein, partial [Gammaproteobacteria bacterium]
GYTAYAYDVAVSGNYAYVANWQDGLLVLDIQSPANPVRAGAVATDGLAQGVAISGKYAFVAGAAYISAGLEIIDISNPARPQRVGSYRTPSGSDALDVAVSGNYAYVAARFDGLLIVDISNPANPVRIGAYDTGIAQRVAVFGNYVYVADYFGGLQVIDIRNPANPQRVGGNTAFDPINVTVSGGRLFAAAHEGLFMLDLFTRPLRFGSPIGYADNRFHFSLEGEPGQSVRVQRSDNLRDWQPWLSVTLGDVSLPLTDTNAPGRPHRWYRAVSP